jgi:hypothetical protein
VEPPSSVPASSLAAEPLDELEELPVLEPLLAPEDEPAPDEEELVPWVPPLDEPVLVAPPLAAFELEELPPETVPDDEPRAPPLDVLTGDAPDEEEDDVAALDPPEDELLPEEPLPAFCCPVPTPRVLKPPIPGSGAEQATSRVRAPHTPKRARMAHGSASLAH